MQYLLTEEEYRNFIPKDWYKKEQEKVQLLNNKVMELSEHPCGRQKRKKFHVLLRPLSHRSLRNKNLYKTTTVFKII